MKNVAIVGGGASGLFVANMLKADYKVTIFEKNDRVGKKLLQTGNGRCNLSNLHSCNDLDKFCLNYNNFEFAKQIFTNFSVEDTIKAFEKLGLLLTYQDDLIYPATYQASTVLDVLRLNLNSNVKIICNCEIVSITKKNAKFFLTDNEGKTYYQDIVILCGGGNSSVTSNPCYKLVTQLGHTLTALYPSLAPIKCVDAFLKGLNGIKANVKASLYNSGRLVQSVNGEVMFKDYGISGIAIFELSRFKIDNNSKIELDLFPDIDIDTIITNRCKTNLTCENLFTGLLNNKIALNLLFKLGYDVSTPLSQVDAIRICNLVKKVSLTQLSVLPFDKSQVTKGGVDLSQVDAQTMSSNLVEDLYFIGELLDIDGNCGGYNLQFAWSSAGICAKSINSLLSNR
ncbi:MAG: aminoacetone oxidase family FAD-binding enzyme [Clostridia bacterium]